MVGDPLTITWETEPHFMGAFKANLPGQYRYQRRLFTQFMQRGMAAAERGFFLCGDDVSWTAGFTEARGSSGTYAVPRPSGRPAVAVYGRSRAFPPRTPPSRDRPRACPHVAHLMSDHTSSPRWQLGCLTESCQ